MATTTDLIQQLYVAYFNRPADVAGLAFYVDAYDNRGASIDLISKSFNNAAEYTDAYKGKSSDEIVSIVYHNLFGRTPDSEGLNFWSPKIASGAISTADLVKFISAGAVNADGTPNSDGLIFNNKVAAAGSFTAEIGTAGNENERIAYASGTAAVMTAAKNYIAGVTTDATLAAAQASVHTTAQAIYASTIPVVNTALSTNIDTVVGGAGNDVITGSGATSTLTGLDNIDGGGGTNTLNVTSVGAITTAGATVKNIQVANLVSAADVTATTTAWTGLTNLNITSGATAGETVTAAATTTLNLTNSTAFGLTVVGTGGALVVSNAGGQIDVGQTAVANAITSASITGGVAVNVSDRSGASAAVGSTLKSVALDGNTGAATLAGNAITAVSVANTNQNLTVTAAAATRADVITVNTVTGGIYTDATATTATLTSTGAANTVADLAVAAATKVILNGDKALTLTTTHLGAATNLTVSGSALTTVSGFNTTNVLTSVTVTGAGGLSSDLSGQTLLTSIDASGSSGANSVTLGAAQAYKGGSGVDTVTMTAAPTVAVDGGAGTADVFVVNAASFALTNVKNFETLGLGALATGAYSAAGFTHLTEGAVTAGVTYNTVAAGTDLTITGSVGFGTVYTLATDTATDVLNLKLSSAAAINGGAVTATNVETVNITTFDSNTTKHVDSMTLVDTALTTLKVSGNAGLNLGTGTMTTITSIDASGMTNTAGTAATGFSYTTGVLAAASTIKGSATGGDVINAAAAVAAVTITETAGTNSITGSSTIASTLTGGTGADTIVGGAGKDVIVGGGGADIITGGAGADTITLSGVTAKLINAALLDSGTNTSTTIQTAELTSTFDVVKGAAAGDTIQLFTSTPAVNLTATNLAGTDDVVNFARGTYDAAAGTFTYAANGLDTAMTYDTTVGAGTAFETIILVGYTAGTTTAVAAGLITLA
ncbi:MULTISPECIES: DUF4214 domain-containing protein [unclassified Duganella]|uniref:DUF4214 domain-containing protein n=1 Tax=unclassified Duganella TaxID=2636909 RepID=UPI000E34DB6F|nr:MULTISPECIES: DUF4214 domain-containing protein [unclassified Duganella]RFP11899.1 DUF4214 domain-containing protein [Duganella sp. BJB475]RFP31465.1 DUF4214 domain-containing protein [Duganella sp. BJB476]